MQPLAVVVFEVVTLFFACFKAGLIAVPLNTRLAAPEIAWTAFATVLSAAIAVQNAGQPG